MNEELLTAREMFAVERYFGLNGHERKNSREVGERLSVSAEQASNLIRKGLVKLKVINSVKDKIHIRFLDPSKIILDVDKHTKNIPTNDLYYREVQCGA
jgi:DNA-directed RNA polymerase sigma subunit (sigma70/sigma32)